MEIVEHWSYGKYSADRIPSSCEAVVVLTSLSNHMIDAVAVKEAKRRRIPFARVHHKISRARPLLESAGFVSNGVSVQQEAAEEQGLLVGASKRGSVP